MVNVSSFAISISLNNNPWMTRTALMNIIKDCIAIHLWLLGLLASCKCIWKFNDIKCNSNQNWNRCSCKYLRKYRVHKKNNIPISSTFTCENGKSIETNIGDSVITCEAIIEMTKMISTSLKGKR